MAVNDFVPFCETTTGTNLLTQSEYLVDAQRPIGNQPGVARSKLVNKALRQATYITAALAQFISDHSGDNVLDDATQSEVLATLLKVIRGYPRSEVALSTGNGYGSASTTIFRFSTIDKNAGTAITYADSSTLGATFTINEDGVYAISATAVRNGGGSSVMVVGISVNGVGITANQYNDAVMTAQAVTGDTLNLVAGDIVRIYGNGSSTNNVGGTRMRITQVSK